MRIKSRKKAIGKAEKSPRNTKKIDEFALNFLNNIYIKYIAKNMLNL